MLSASTGSGPLVTCDLQARRLGSNFRGVIGIKEDGGGLIADAADTQGLDVSLSWKAVANRRYRIEVRDLDFRGNRANVYRLSVSQGPRILAALPAAGPRGESVPVDLIGYGVATGECRLERVTCTIPFSDDPEQESFACALRNSGRLDRGVFVSVERRAGARRAIAGIEHGPVIADSSGRHGDA